MEWNAVDYRVIRINIPHTHYADEWPSVTHRNYSTSAHKQFRSPSPSFTV